MEINTYIIAVLPPCRDGRGLFLFTLRTMSMDKLNWEITASEESQGIGLEIPTPEQVEGDEGLLMIDPHKEPSDSVGCIDKNTFIIQSAQKIMAGMMANPDKDANAESALMYAEQLWDTLTEGGYITEEKK